MSVDFTKYPNKISNSGYDENKKYKGGKAGDQTGHEWKIINWYNRPWTVILRHPDKKTRELIAQYAIEAANNNKIGYDQNDRYTYWAALQKAGYRPSKVTVACEADCSAGVIANVRAVGHVLGNKKLQNIGASYTGNMKNGFIKAGFEALTDSKYLKDSSYLVPGDILLYENHHTATNICIGTKVKYTSYKEEEEKSTTGKNETTTSTKQIQTMLNKVGEYNLKVDNKYGPLTTAAVKDFQSKNKITATGNMNNATLTKLKSLYKASEKTDLIVPINTTGNYSDTPKFKGTITTLLNIRKTPKVTDNNNLTSYPTLPAGTEVKICDATRDANGTVWYYIQINGSKGIKYGFASSKYITVSKL